MHHSKKKKNLDDVKTGGPWSLKDHAVNLAFVNVRGQLLHDLTYDGWWLSEKKVNRCEYWVGDDIRAPKLGAYLLTTCLNFQNVDPICTFSYQAKFLLWKYETVILALYCLWLMQKPFGRRLSSKQELNILEPWGLPVSGVIWIRFYARRRYLLVLLEQFTVFYLAMISASTAQIWLSFFLT